MVREGLPYCSLICDEIRNYGGRRVCGITEKAVTTKFVENGALCEPGVSEMRCRLQVWQNISDNPGHMLVRTAAALVRTGDASS